MAIDSMDAIAVQGEDQDGMDISAHDCHRQGQH